MGKDKLELKAEMGGLEEAHVLADFILFKDKHKDWAIAVVKNCDEIILPETLGSIEIRCNTTHGRCDVCKFLIENVPLTEEDLK